MKHGGARRATWNDGMIERLTQLWAEGHSASKIGDTLGVGKNAVIGKAHRLGLAQRRSPIKGGGIVKGSKHKPPTPPAHIKIQQLMRTPRSPTPYTGPNTLDQLAADQCRYTASTTKPFIFCAKPIEVDGPYCAEHRDLCYAKQGKQAGETSKWTPWKGWG